MIDMLRICAGEFAIPAIFSCELAATTMPAATALLAASLIGGKPSFSASRRDGTAFHARHQWDGADYRLSYYARLHFADVAD